MTRHEIAVIPGDGIGKEVVPEGLRALRRVGEVTGGFEIEVREYPWSCQRYMETGSMMPSDGLAQLADSDAIYLGAVGFPGVPDHVSLWGLLLPIRQGFDQYVNLRPVKVLDGIPGPLRDKGRPTSTSYASVRTPRASTRGLGGRFQVGTPQESRSRHRCSRAVASNGSRGTRSNGPASATDGSPARQSRTRSSTQP